MDLVKSDPDPILYRIHDPNPVQIRKCLFGYEQQYVVDYGTGVLKDKWCHPRKAIAYKQQCAVEDETGVLRAKWCHPQKEAAALYKQVTASSTCGQSAQQSYCLPPSAPEAAGSAGRVRWPEIVCGKCDSRVPLRLHSAALLTDAHSALHHTCWLSEPLRRNEENVTLEVAFGKRYEVCVLLHFSSST